MHKFEDAPADVIERFEDLARELFSDILEMSYDECLVTDESCMCDFITDETPNDFVERFARKYGFEPAKLRHARIADLVREIAARSQDPDVN